jgi:UDP-N-acetylglucosamine 4-epimerase
MTGSASSHRIAMVRRELSERPRCWLITGVAGFIGSHLLEELLRLGQTVRGLDNFITGHRANLEEVRSLVGSNAWGRFTFLEGDIRDYSTCQDAVAGAQYVLHEAAIRSMVRSLRDPRTTNDINITGFLNVLTAAKEQGVERFVYAGSSSTYGDHPALPRSEDSIGRLLSPYAVTKYANELYSEVFARHFDFPSVGLRYFNVFGPRQDPHGEYAPVISKWILSIMKGEDIEIYGDGETTRDFCYVADIVQANLLAALPKSDINGEVFNVATGEGVSLNQAFLTLLALLAEVGVAYAGEPRYRDFRPGDARHSHADISKAVQLLGYAPTRRFKDGVRDTLSWYLRQPALADDKRQTPG